MVWYLEIGAIQEPFDNGLDQAGRSETVFNVIAMKQVSGTFIEELVKILENAGVGTRAVNIFATAQAVIPDGPGPYLSVIETGGAAPLRVHNPPVFQAKYGRPAAQIAVRALDSAVGRAMSYAAYTALLSIRNVEVVP